MGVISMREFNANVSRVFALIDAGEEVIVTRRGKKPVRLAPAELPEHEDQKTRDLARLGELMNMGKTLDGPATYEERTGLDRLL
jgi:antitoxin (DNA-binding transcriptional repressor) of toxin-antitoxin stability system